MEDWDEAAATWDTDPSVARYSEMAYSMVERHALPALATGGLGKVVDIGCGTGQLTERLHTQTREIVAVEPSAAMLAKLQAKQLANVQCVAGVLDDALAAKHEASVDLVVASSVCAFVPDYAALVGRVGRMLKVGGVFLQLDWEDAEATLEDHADGFSREALAAGLSGTGLEAVLIDKVVDFAMEGHDTASMPVVALVARRSSILVY